MVLLKSFPSLLDLLTEHRVSISFEFTVRTYSRVNFNYSTVVLTRVLNETFLIRSDSILNLLHFGTQIIQQIRKENQRGALCKTYTVIFSFFFPRKQLSFPDCARVAEVGIWLFQKLHQCMHLDLELCDISFSYQCFNQTCSFFVHL